MSSCSQEPSARMRAKETNVKSKSVERREAEQRKARHIPMTLGGDDPRTRLAFSVWRTGPPRRVAP